MAVFESLNVRGVRCRAGLSLQVTMAFGTDPIDGVHDVYAAMVFAVAGSAFKAFDLIGVMDWAIVAT